MPKRISKKRLDTVQNARRVVLASVEDTEPAKPASSPSLVSQVMAEMGRKGGQIGGKRRLVTMTALRRRQVAKLGAKARWAKKKKSAA